MPDNKNLIHARLYQSVEYYTTIETINKELDAYSAHFENKIILCNCDDPRESKFFYYFYQNFHRLKIKKIISTSFKKRNVNLLNDEYEKAVYVEYTGEEKPKIKYLKGDGDFRSRECIEFLKQSDIVVTNPPFNLFFEFVSYLVKYDKKFIILGNIIKIYNRKIFSLFLQNKIWLGHSIKGGGTKFNIPEYYSTFSDLSGIDSNNRKFTILSGIRWYTNLNHHKPNEKIKLNKRYYGNEKLYPKYDNYDAIEVSETKNIPMDYDGKMGVPITFLDRFNPEQFRIIDKDLNLIKKSTGKSDKFKINGNIIFARVVIVRVEY